MAWDDYDCFYHLTPRGWKIADEPPRDTAWTLAENTYQRSGFSKEVVTWRAEPPRVSREAVERLLKTFPFPEGSGTTAQAVRRLLDSN